MSNERKPVFVLFDPVDANKPIGFEEAQPGDASPVANGGTGANDAASARTNLGLSDADIKTAYEGNADTNAYSDAEKVKLAAVETGSELNTGSNLDVPGSDAQVFDVKTGSVFTFRTLVASAGISILQDANHINLSVTQGAGSGLDADKLDGAEGSFYQNTDNHTDGATNRVYAATDKTKLSGIETAATADQTDAEIETAYNAQVPVVDQPTAEAGTSTTVVRWTPERVKQAIAALESASITDHGFLSGLADDDHPQYFKGADVIDEDDMVSNSATKVPTQQSTKAYVDAAVVSSVQYRGGYDAATNTPDLDTAPVGVTTGDMYTVTVAGTFFTAAVEIGDVLISEQDSPTLESHWTIVNKNLDATSIKTSYESNADTNAYTDAERAKLAGIETAATADQTGAEIKASYELEANTNAYTDAEKTKLTAIEPLANVNDKNIKSINVENPTSTEDITFFYAPAAITIIELVAVIQGTTSVTWTLHHATDRTLAGNKVVTAGTTTSSTTTGEIITTFNDATIPANSFVWLETSAISGTPGAFFLSVEFTED